MSHDPSERRPIAVPAWSASPPRRGWRDLLAVSAWTAALAAFFRDVVLFRGALFYFDITEINLPYRDFFARELKAGRFSRWCPGLYCGMPLYSESQAGYLHPLKYFLYPWLEAWQAFGLDTALSVWLTGLATYGWLRRHVGPAGALTGAAVFGLSGFVWAHLIHTSMINSLISVPLAVWGLECAWEGGRLRGVALGAAAMACQVFAGHLQDFLLTGLMIGVYGVYRAAIERGRGRAFAIGAAGGLVVLGALLSAVQWVPSKELLDRSPRAEGLTWATLTYGSWHPELLPTVVLREAYGTRARDTDWMDGFYPYHEMNTYVGLVAIALAVVGAGALRDRWVAFWVLLAGLGGLLMLGRYTALLDHAHRVPVLGSSRIPVRFHLWVALAAAALAGVGVDRLARPDRVRLRWAVGLAALLVVVSLPIMLYEYTPALAHPERWPKPYLQLRFGWLREELISATVRTTALATLGLLLAAIASRRGDRIGGAAASLLPLVVIGDLLGAHWNEVPTIDPRYWTAPPESARLIRADPDHQRVLGYGAFSAGEPGYASYDVNFMQSRDTLAWSLPPVYGLRSIIGETPMIPTRWKRYMDATKATPLQLSLAWCSHVLIGNRSEIPGWSKPARVGAAYVSRNPDPLPRARIAGRPVYADDEDEAVALLENVDALGPDRPIVEDPDRPLPADAEVTGTAEIVDELPERLVIRTEADGDAYLILADTYDPGWSATVDGDPAPVRPAYVNFRAVPVPAGRHEVVFRYTPAGFRIGLTVSVVGLAVAIVLLLRRSPVATLGPTHGPLGWPSWWPWAAFAIVAATIAASAVRVGPDGLGLHPRWRASWHTFTWESGLLAMDREPEPERGPAR